jgi:hypothetical protein
MSQDSFIAKVEVSTKIDPDSVTWNPGEPTKPTKLTLTITNEADRDVTFALNVSKGDSWVSLPVNSDKIFVPARRSKPIRISVTPPDKPLAGVHVVEIGTIDVGNISNQHAARAQLHVNRVGDYRVDLVEPSEGTRNTEQSVKYILSVTNNANAPLTVVLEPVPDGLFTWEIPPGTPIHPSNKQDLTVTVRPTNPHQSPHPGTTFKLKTVGTYTLEGGDSEKAPEYQPVTLTWPGPPGPALSITDVTVDPASLRPGKQANLKFTLVNHGREKQQITLSVEGDIPKNWVGPIPAPEPPPGEQTEATIVISVPQDPAQALAGTYSLTVHAVPANDPQGEATGSASIVVEAITPPKVPTSGLVSPVRLEETSDYGPALASLDGRLYLAWTGTDKRLNLISSTDSGVTFGPKVIYPEQSLGARALCALQGDLYWAWTGLDGTLYFGNNKDKFPMNESSPYSPALASLARPLSLNGRFYLAWSGNDNALNLKVWQSDGTSTNNQRYPETLTAAAPALTVMCDDLYIAWRGADNDQLHVGHVVFVMEQPWVIADEVTFPYTSKNTPALASIGDDVNNATLYLAWTDGNNALNLRSSSNYGKTFDNEFSLVPAKSKAAPALGTLKDSLFVAWTDVSDNHLNVAHVLIPT